MNNFPENCIRGIQKASYIYDDGQVSGEVFLPYEKTAENRADKAQETSINWEDDDTVVQITRKEFIYGVVRLQRLELDRVNNLPLANQDISYERAWLKNNQFHGNILYHSHLPRHRIRLIAFSLACACSGVIN